MYWCLPVHLIQQSWVKQTSSCRLPDLPPGYEGTTLVFGKLSFNQKIRKGPKTLPLDSAPFLDLKKKSSSFFIFLPNAPWWKERKKGPVSRCLSRPWHIQLLHYPGTPPGTSLRGGKSLERRWLNKTWHGQRVLQTRSARTFSTMSKKVLGDDLLTCAIFRANGTQ